MDARKIVVAVDGSEHADKALDFACDLSKSKAAELVIAHVQKDKGAAVAPEELQRYNEVEHVNITEQEILAMAAKEVLHEAQKQARDLGVADSRAVLCEGNPVNALVELAETEKADLLVVGSRGISSLDSLLFGSTSLSLERKAGCTVIVVH